MNHLAIMTHVRNWFKAINDKVDDKVLIEMLSSKGFLLRFPEATLTDESSFRSWYKGVKQSFFDQNHIIRHLEIKLDGDRAHLAVWVNWRATTRPEGSSQSKVCDFDAMQEWEMIRENGHWVITRYDVVDILDNLKH